MYKIAFILLFYTLLGLTSCTKIDLPDEIPIDFKYHLFYAEVPNQSPSVISSQTEYFELTSHNNPPIDFSTHILLGFYKPNCNPYYSYEVYKSLKENKITWHIINDVRNGMEFSCPLQIIDQSRNTWISIQKPDTEIQLEILFKKIYD